MTRTLAILIAAALLAALPAAEANDDFAPGTTHATLDTGATFGGDRLATVNYLFGGHSSVYAGKSIYVDFGFLHNLDGSDWSLKGTAGIQTGYAWGYHSVSFNRYPLDFLALYNDGRFHFGAGLTYHANPKLDQNGYAPDVAFHDAVGGILEFQYWLFGLRYTNIRYTASGPCLARCSYDGSNLGLYVSFVF